MTQKILEDIILDILQGLKRMENSKQKWDLNLPAQLLISHQIM